MLHLDLDQGRATAVRYRQLAVGMGLAGQSVPLEVYPFPFKLTDPDTKELLLRMCAGVTLCVVDSLRGAIDGDENDSAFATPLYMLGAVSEATGCVFKAIHHEGKGDTSGKPGAEVMRGTSALPGAAGAVHQYTLGDGCVKLAQRRADACDWRPAFTPVHLGMAIEPSSHPWLLDPGDGCHLDAIRINVVEPGATPAADSLHEQIRRLLEQSPGLSTSSLYAKLGGNKPALFEKVRVMLDDGALFNGGSQSHPALFARRPSELLADLIERSGTNGVAVRHLSDATKLTAKQLAPHLELLKQDGAILMWDVEGSARCITRPSP